MKPGKTGATTIVLATGIILVSSCGDRGGERSSAAGDRIQQVLATGGAEQKEVLLEQLVDEGAVAEILGYPGSLTKKVEESSPGVGTIELVGWGAGMLECRIVLWVCDDATAAGKRFADYRHSIRTCREIPHETIGDESRACYGLKPPFRSVMDLRSGRFAVRVSLRGDDSVAPESIVEVARHIKSSLR